MIKADRQMYKIYINDTPLILTDTSTNPTPKITDDELVAFYPGKRKFLLNYIDMLEKNKNFKSITLYSPNLDKLYSDFSTHFDLLEAAGGLVFNPQNELLVIYRRGSWDLPKGKIDPGESKEEAAVREVQEETGLQQVELGNYWCLTRHTYKDKKGRRVLKLTHWFEMSTPEQQLTPQTEEDIEVAEWQAPEVFLGDGRHMYNSIREVVSAWKKKQEKLRGWHNKKK